MHHRNFLYSLFLYKPFFFFFLQKKLFAITSAKQNNKQSLAAELSCIKECGGRGKRKDRRKV